MSRPARLLPSLCLLLAGLASAAGAQAAGDPLATEMKARVEKEMPGVTARIDSADQLRLFRGGKEVGVLDLGNLREICVKRAADVCERQKANRIAVQQEVEKAGADTIAPQAMRLIVRPASYKQAVERQLAEFSQGKSAEEKKMVAEGAPLLKPLGRDFVLGWAQDSERGMRPLSESALRKAGLSAADADRLGAANLLREDIAPLTPAGAKYPGVFATQGNDYLPSVLVDDAFWQRVAGTQAKQNVAICLPARHELFIYVPALDSAKSIDFPHLCRTLARNAAPTFSDRVVQRVDGKWLLN